MIEARECAVRWHTLDRSKCLIKRVHVREGELLASTQLAQVAKVIGSQPAALQRRYLQTLTGIAVEKHSTIIFPLPIDPVAPLMEMMQHQAQVSVPHPLNGLHEEELSLLREQRMRRRVPSHWC